MGAHHPLVRPSCFCVTRPEAEMWGLGWLCCGDCAGLQLCHWLQTLLRGTGQSHGAVGCQLLALSLADGEECWLLGSCARTCFQAWNGSVSP